eukprot:10866619-Ditylum_brightwellii.AAC.1
MASSHTALNAYTTVEVGKSYPLHTVAAPTSHAPNADEYVLGTGYELHQLCKVEKYLHCRLLVPRRAA